MDFSTHTSTTLPQCDRGWLLPFADNIFQVPPQGFWRRCKRWTYCRPRQRTFKLQQWRIVLDGFDLARDDHDTVAIRAFKYQPASLTVEVGDTVIWVNEDIVPHTATASGKRFDSRSVDAQRSWRYVPDRKGTFPYACTFHPMMKGAVIVR